MATHDQQNGHEHDGQYGMALGFRLVEEEGQIYLAEAEISPYVDAPEELGATLVFHPLEGINPVEAEEEMDWPAWPIDIDDDLTRDTSAPIPAQFKAIVRQLHGLSEQQLLEYLRVAREEAEA